MPKATPNSATSSAASQSGAGTIARVILRRTLRNPLPRLAVALGVIVRPLGMDCCAVLLPDTFKPRLDAWREDRAFMVRVGRYEAELAWGLDCGLPRWWSGVKAQAGATPG